MEELVIIFQLLDSNADIPYPVTILNRTPIIEWYVVWYGSKNGYKNGMHHVFERDWAACSEFASHSKFNSQPDTWEDLSI